MSSTTVNSSDLRGSFDDLMEDSSGEIGDDSSEPRLDPASFDRKRPREDSYHEEENPHGSRQKKCHEETNVIVNITSPEVNITKLKVWLLY